MLAFCCISLHIERYPETIENPDQSLGEGENI